jgi:pyruvate dehydrogenase E2 component (dihydrolipoamide acetyltransferase)
MVVEVILPKQGMYDGEVTLVEWLVVDGAAVAVGDPLFVVETDKVETEVEADDAGLLVITVPAGSELPVGSVIGFLADTAAEAEAIRSAQGTP